MDNNEIVLPVLEVSQSMGTFYIASISAKALVSIAYADARRIEARDVEKYVGIQRPLDPKRVNQIKQYLLSPDASFPTGIVLAVDQKCTIFENGTLKLKPYKSEFLDDPDDVSIPFKNIAKILDGQHRIAAFLKGDVFDEELAANIGVEFQFNVNIFIGLDIDEQANIFATVNLAQTKVNSSLVYDLEGLAKTRSPFKSCHQIAVALDSANEKSPLYHRIKRLGVKTKGREIQEPLTQAAFVEALVKLISPQPFDDRVKYLKGKKPDPPYAQELSKHPFRNFFLQGKDTDIALILYNYFSAIRATWEKAWDGVNVTGNILPRSNAFKAFMRFLKDIYNQIDPLHTGKIPSVEDFKTYIQRVDATDEDFTSGNFKPGSGGEYKFYALLKGETTIEELKNN